MTVTLDAAARDLKLRMYKSFRSQFALLHDFPRDIERFRMAPRYDFTRKPYEGRLFYDDFDLGMDSDRFAMLARQALREN